MSKCKLALNAILVLLLLLPFCFAAAAEGAIDRACSQSAAAV